MTYDFSLMGGRVKFLKSVYDLKDLPAPLGGRREVVLVGRSNVGKSSLLNYLTASSAAKVGKTPGRTRAINYFEWDTDLFKAFLVDLPGYGFARGDRAEIERWKELIEGYFKERKDNVALVLVLIDAKVGPTADDALTLRWLRHLGVPFTVVLTKTDKAKQREISQTLKKLKELGVERPLQTSARERRGKEALMKEIAAALRR